MAITTTTLNGTDSVAASRITLNDNFQTIEDALNDVLSIIDIATGKINNYGYGSNNDMETEDLIVRGSTGGGINVISGNVTVGNGNVVIGGTSGTGYVQIGAGGNSIKFEKVSRSFYVAPGNIPTINLCGATGATGTGPIGYMTIPRIDTATMQDIADPWVGSLVYDTTGGTGGTGALAVCVATGLTGDWKYVSIY